MLKEITLQIHVDPQQSAFVKSTGLPVAPYDGVVEWEAERLEDILGIMGSDEYKKVGVRFTRADGVFLTSGKQYLAPDELKFFQKAEVFVGRGQTEFKSGYTG